MARSIHTTRRALWVAKRWQTADDARQSAEVESLGEGLATKRRVKRGSKVERPALLPTSPDVVPIRVIDEGPYIHYPASPDDIRTALRLLPPGVLDGLQEIALRLGAGRQDALNWMGEPSPSDPLVGRPGVTMVPGVYTGNCLGVYGLSTAQIELYAYVYHDALPDRAMWECYMRLQALGTLMHEVAHHFDVVNRTARGRWRADRTEHVEHYAEDNGFRWTRDLVIPYLERAYAADVQRFGEWTLHHGGMAVPLASLLAGPGPMRKGERTYSPNDAFFSMQNAVDTLAEDVAAGHPPLVTRLEFARSIHYRDEFDQALVIVDAVLADAPDDLDGLTLRADILVHLKRHGEAEQLARRILAADDTLDGAWDVLADVYEAMRDGANLLMAVQRCIALLGRGRRIDAHLLFTRALAWLWLGDRRRYRADLATLRGRKRPPKQLIKRLQEEEARMREATCAPA